MEQITLSILGREYRVACRPEERNELLACAHYVDQKMASIRDGGKVLGADRVAVLAALQIAQELFGARVRMTEKSPKCADDCATSPHSPTKFWRHKKSCFKQSYRAAPVTAWALRRLECGVPAVFAQRPFCSLNQCALRKVAALVSWCDRHAFAEPKRRGRRPS